MTANSHWQALGKNDWSDIVALSAKKVYQRKFQIIEAFVRLVADFGYHNVTHADIARECRITRQLVDHHFATDISLLLLTYQYIYARFQKVGADSVIARADTLDQFRAYLRAVANWVVEHRPDACFLTQHFALSSVYPELFALHERNILLGQERIRTMLSVLKKQGVLTGIAEDKLVEYAGAIQTHLAGYIVFSSAMPKHKINLKESTNTLVRACLSIVGIEAR